MTGSVYIGLLHDTRDWRRHENGMKNGNRFEQPSRCKGGRHDDNRSTSKRKTRRRGTRRRRCSSPQYSGRGPPIGSYRDPHLGIFHQSWRWVMLLKFFWRVARIFLIHSEVMHASIAHAHDFLAVISPPFEFMVAISITYRFILLSVSNTN